LTFDSAVGTFNEKVNKKENCIKMSGLPFKASEKEMRDFFLPEAKCVSVKVILNRDGRPSGDAIAAFEGQEEVESAMKKDREHLGTRFIVLSRYILLSVWVFLLRLGESKISLILSKKMY
jgi:RNA recognition motif-containing protein